MSEGKILVADDEIHIIHVVAIKLRNNGYEVITAQDGAEAYELACEHKPDIVVSDLQMPIMNGFEFIEKLRANELMADVPVIMLTARSFEIEDEEKQRLKISECLSKPFSPKELLRIVEDVLYQRMVANESG